MALVGVGLLSVLLVFICWCGWKDARADAAVAAELAGVRYTWTGATLERVEPAPVERVMSR